MQQEKEIKNFISCINKILTFPEVFEPETRNWYITKIRKIKTEEKKCDLCLFESFLEVETLYKFILSLFESIQKYFKKDEACAFFEIFCLDNTEIKIKTLKTNKDFISEFTDNIIEKNKDLEIRSVTLEF